MNIRGERGDIRTFACARRAKDEVIDRLEAVGTKQYEVQALFLDILCHHRPLRGDLTGEENCLRAGRSNYSDKGREVAVVLCNRFTPGDGSASAFKSLDG